MAWSNSYHPVRRYLNGLEWDGVSRLEGFAFTYLGTEVDPQNLRQAVYIRSVCRAFFISGVARILDPGCKADHMLILEGDQGIGKSTAARIMAKHDEWFSDSLPHDLKHKDAKDHIRGVWICEMGELANLRKNEAETIKVFLSHNFERFRESYARHEDIYPRQCVFIGTVNPGDEGYLKDPTGNRRFWPIACGDKILTDELADDIDLLWAEAVHLYKKGERWHLEGEEVIEAAKDEQSAREEDDPWTEDVLTWVEEDEPGTISKRQSVTTNEVLEKCLNISVEKKSSFFNKRIAGILKKAGWKKKKTRNGWIFFRPKT